MKKNTSNSSLLCRTFGHKFERVYSITSKPVSPFVVENQLLAIKNGVHGWEVREYLQKQVELVETSKTLKLVYCKRCGYTVE